MVDQSILHCHKMTDISGLFSARVCLTKLEVGSKLIIFTKKLAFIFIMTEFEDEKFLTLLILTTFNDGLHVVIHSVIHRAKYVGIIRIGMVVVIEEIIFIPLIVLHFFFKSGVWREKCEKEPGKPMAGKS